MLSISSRLFEEWNSSGIKYCHWKSNEHLMEGLDGLTDLDVLVDKSNRDDCIKIYNKLSFIPCRSQYGSRYPDVEDWLGFDEETGRMIHLHHHYAIITGHRGLKEYNLPWTMEALNTRHLDEVTGVYVSDPSLELITLYTRIGLKAYSKTLKAAKGGEYRISESDQKEIDYLSKRVNQSVLSKLVEFYFPCDATEMERIINSKTLGSDDYLVLSSITARSLNKCNRYNRIGSWILRPYYRITLHLRSMIKKVYPYALITRKTPKTSFHPVVCFLGQDGSGKSTVTKEINSWLSWKLDSRRFYLGSGDEHYNPWQKRLHKKIHKNDAPWAKLLRAWLPFSYQLASARYVKRTIKQANQFASLGGIALLDRYPQIEVAGINDGPKIRSSLFKRVPKYLLGIAKVYASIEERILAKATRYSPSLVIKLMLSTEESMRRKPFENQEMVQHKHEIINNLQFPDSDVVVIDAEQDYETEIRQIKKEIWQRLLQ